MYSRCKRFITSFMVSSSQCCVVLCCVAVSSVLLTVSRWMSVPLTIRSLLLESVESRSCLGARGGVTYCSEFAGNERDRGSLDTAAVGPLETPYLRDDATFSCPTRFGFAAVRCRYLVEIIPSGDDGGVYDQEHLATPHRCHYAPWGLRPFLARRLAPPGGHRRSVVGGTVLPDDAFSCTIL